MINPANIRYTAFLLLLILFFVSVVNFNYARSKIKSLLSGFNQLYFAFILLFIGYINFDTFSPTDLATVDLGASKYFQVITMGSALVISVLYAYRNNLSTAKIFTTPILLLFIYAYVAICSSFFLTTSYYLPVYKAMLLMVDFFIVAVIMSLENSAANFKLMFNIIKLEFTLLILLFIFGVLVSPRLALKPNFGIFNVQLFGVIPTIHPNTVGFISVIAFIFFWSEVIRSDTIKQKLLFGHLLICTLFVIVLAQSRTSIIAMFTGITLFELLRKKYKWLLIIFITVFLVFLYHYKTANQYWLRGTTQEQMATLSGRTIGWEYAVSRFFDAPFMGYGFAGGIRFGSAWGSRYFQAILTNLHNSYGEVLLSVGLFGFIPWFTSIVYIMFNTLKNFFTHRKNTDRFTIQFQYSIEIVTILSCCIIRTFTGSIFVYHDFLFFILLLFMFYSQLNFLDSKWERFQEK